MPIASQFVFDIEVRALDIAAGIEQASSFL
jgi:hypothetical protein